MDKLAGAIKKLKELFDAAKAQSSIPEAAKEVQDTASTLLKHGPKEAKEAIIARNMAKIEEEYKRTKNKAKYLDDMNALERGVQADKAKDARKITRNKVVNVAAGLGVVGLGLSAVGSEGHKNPRREMIAHMRGGHGYGANAGYGADAGYGAGQGYDPRMLNQ